MLGRRIWNFIILCFIICFYVFSEHYVAFLLLIIAIAFVLFSAWSVFIGRGKVELDLETSGAIHKNEPGFIYIHARNHSFLPISNVKVRLSFKNQLTGENRKEELLIALNGKEEDRIPIEVMNEFCGSIKIQLDEVIIYDFIGLFSTGNEINSTSELYVLPNYFSIVIDTDTKLSQSEDDNLQSNQRKGVSGEDIFDIRPYSPGDHVRHIHWNMTNKFDSIMVKELSEPVDHSFLVLLERVKGNSDEIIPPEVNDAMLEALVSVSHSLLDRNHLHSIGWVEEETGMLRVEDVLSKDTLTTKLRTLLKLGEVNGTASTIDTYLEERDALSFSHVIYIGAELSNSNIVDSSIPNHITILSCDKKQDRTNTRDSVRFTPENMEQKLSYLTV